MDIKNSEKIVENFNIDQLHLMRKYFDRWKHFKRYEHLPKVLDSETMDKFIEYIQKRKEKLSEKPVKPKTKNYNYMENYNISKDIVECKIKNNLKINGKTEHNRLQVQTQTIALLKAQLEQKERIIEQLKLKKIIEDTNSNCDVMNDIKDSFNQCSISVKPKMKCVIKETKSEESITDDNLKIHCLKVPKFLQKMERRAREREEKRKIVTERRKQIEFEKERLKEQMRLEKEIKDQEERTQRIKEFRERYRREQLLAIQRKEFIERMRSLCVMADLHYEKKIFAKYGNAVLKLFMTKVKKDHEDAICFNKRRIMKLHFSKLSIYVKATIKNKNEKADLYYCNKLKVSAFKELKTMRKEMLCKLYTAEDWYDNYIINEYFTIWRQNARKIKKIYQRQWKIAVTHHERWLKWRVIGCWETLPAIAALEREREARKQRWRLKVQQVLPDFIPRDMN